MNVRNERDIVEQSVKIEMTIRSPLVQLFNNFLSSINSSCSSSLAECMFPRALLQVDRGNFLSSINSSCSSSLAKCMFPRVLLQVDRGNDAFQDPLGCGPF